MEILVMMAVSVVSILGVVISMIPPKQSTVAVRDFEWDGDLRVGVYTGGEYVHHLCRYM